MMMLEHQVLLLLRRLLLLLTCPLRTPSPLMRSALWRPWRTILFRLIQAVFFSGYVLVQSLVRGVKKIPLLKSRINVLRQKVNLKSSEARAHWESLKLERENGQGAQKKALEDEEALKLLKDTLKFTVDGLEKARDRASRAEASLTAFLTRATGAEEVVKISRLRVAFLEEELKGA